MGNRYVSPKWKYYKWENKAGRSKFFRNKVPKKYVTKSTYKRYKSFYGDKF